MRHEIITDRRTTELLGEGETVIRETGLGHAVVRQNDELIRGPLNNLRVGLTCIEFYMWTEYAFALGATDSPLVAQLHPATLAGCIF